MSREIRPTWLRGSKLPVTKFGRSSKISASEHCWPRPDALERAVSLTPFAVSASEPYESPDAFDQLNVLALRLRLDGDRDGKGSGPCTECRGRQFEHSRAARGHPAHHQH